MADRASQTIFEKGRVPRPDIDTAQAEGTDLHQWGNEPPSLYWRVQLGLDNLLFECRKGC